MNLPFFIARRYLFSKKKHNAINIISGISVCGVALATLALVCTLSVFNGFQDMVAGFFTAFDPGAENHHSGRKGVRPARIARAASTRPARNRCMDGDTGRERNGAVQGPSGNGGYQRRGG